MTSNISDPKKNEESRASSPNTTTNYSKIHNIIAIGSPSRDSLCCDSEFPKMKSILVEPPQIALPSNLSVDDGIQLGCSRPILKKCDVHKASVFCSRNFGRGRKQANDTSAKGSILSEPKVTMPEGDINTKKTLSSNWKVANSSLRPPPEHFILEKTSRFVCCTNATLISTRISDCLRDRSIEATFDDVKAKAKCMTADFVKFHIRLFLGTDEYNTGIIVEIQRRKGSAISFMRDCRAILNSAEGEEWEPQVYHMNSIKQPIQEMDIFKHMKIRGIGIEEAMEQQELSIDHVIDHLRRLFRHNDKANNGILGLEYLRALTDQTKTSIETSQNIIKSILNNKNIEVLNNIISIVQFNIALYPGNNGSDDHRFATLAKLRHLALAVLSNILEVTSANAGGIERLLENNSWFIEGFIPILIHLLKQSKSHPHDSFLAAKALHLLVYASEEAKFKAHDVGGALGAIDEAIQFGKSHHILLAEESARCKISLECN
eukprot:CAMPEP_0172516020 /NCGR_PEP_ID=MMETSP1066-20121228/272699_1 /TAXON_ID=671091 /ORGANISM="Coscinodiscus wailesii, Strain CCMP2513" /LENGTH=489 /DNA_ID=CAMNT_0013297333 /DNA_START=220 /DNA_END=1692 /DNA_ORIENTATION=+